MPVQTVGATMTADDFIAGVLAGLAIRGHHELDVTDRRLDATLAKIYDSLVASNDLSTLDIDFQISPDPIHGDSVVVQEALSVAVQGRIVSRINPTFRRLRINLDVAQASELLDRLPGGRAMYDHIADEFVDQYYGIATP